MSKLPVLVTFFNRPQILGQLLKKIHIQNDIKVFFACDGPRDEKDKELVDQCWGQVYKYFGRVKSKQSYSRSQNLGCKMAMKTNIDWFFSQNPYGVILEDDCIPNSDLFKYIGAGLISHRNSADIMSISGSDSLPQYLTPKTSLFRKSIFPMVWGWGTWAKKWSLYRVDIPDSKEIVELASESLFGKKFSLAKWQFENVFKMRFEEVNQGVIDTWDYSLVASTWRNNFKVLQVNANLVVNSGFNSQATHTKSLPPPWVPNDYTAPSSFNTIVPDYMNNSDLWLVPNVYNCGPVEVMKNQVKKFLRQ